MKVEKIDYLWSVISMIVVGVSFAKGHLIYGLLIIYGLMLILFYYHILKIRSYMAESVAVFGEITDYHEDRRSKRVFPIVRYTTAGGREITSAYTVSSKERRYEIGDEELICYSPDDPMFFYFSGKESELYKDYYRFIIVGGIVAAVLFVISLF